MTPEQRELVESHIGIALRAARNHRVAYLRDEMEGVALERLCQAAVAWTTNPDTRDRYLFRTYVSLRCRGAVRDASRKWAGYSPRRAAPMVHPLGDWDTPSLDPDPADLVCVDCADEKPEGGPDLIAHGVEFWMPTSAPYAWVEQRPEPPTHLRLAS